MTEKTASDLAGMIVDQPARPDPMLEMIYRRINLRVLPLLILAYMLAYLDRINIGFAKLQMQHALGLSEAAYGLAAGIFFLGYVLFEVPSNLLLARIGARKTLSRIMVLWGLTSAAMIFVRTETSFYVLRFLLGVFEAGFGPGMLFFLTLWYGRARRARVMASVLLAGPIAGVIGGPLSTMIMTTLDGFYGLSGWQWLFLVEGLPCVFLAAVLYLTLVDSPGQASWLSEAERALVDREVAWRNTPHHTGFAAILKDPRLYGLAFSYFFMIAGLYAVSFWLPTLLHTTGVDDTMLIGIYSALPYLVSVAAMVMVARHSDRHGERFWHCVIPCLIGAVTLGLVGYELQNLFFALATLTVATAAVYASYTLFWTIPAERLGGQAAAGGIALINSIGLLGGFLSPIVIGNIKTWTGSLQFGLLTIAVGLSFGGLLLIMLRPALGGVATSGDITTPQISKA